MRCWLALTMDKKKEEKNSRNTRLDEFGVVESNRCSQGKDVVCKNDVKGIDFLVARSLYAIRISHRSSLIAHRRHRHLHGKIRLRYFSFLSHFRKMGRRTELNRIEEREIFRRSK